MLLLAAALVLVACPAAQPAAPSSAPAQAAAPAAEATKAPAAETAPAAKDKQIIFALYQEPEILNPFIATQTAAGEASTFIVEGLLGVDPGGNRYPQLAQEVPSIANGLVSEDGLTVKYNLLEDVVWSDGEPFTCDDVLFTFEAITDPASGAVSTTGYNKIASVTCDSDHAVTIQFSEFYAPYLALFGAIMPRHATGPTAEMQNWEYNWNLVGTGPFMQKEWVNGDHITLVANPNYRDYPDKPKVQQVIVRIIPSREVGKALITSGEIDILWDLTEADVPEFEANPNVVVNKKSSPGTERLVLNLADPTLDATDDPLNNPHPILGDALVRKAIDAGIDKQFLVDELLFGATTVGVSELSIGWAKCDIPTAEYSPETAMSLLEEAGWTDADGNGIRECNGCKYAEPGTPLRLKLQTTTGNQLREETEQLIIEMMRDIGLEFYIENVPSSELFGSWSSGAFRKRGNYDVLMYTTSDGIDPQSQMLGYFHSSQMPLESNGGAGFNYSRWVNAAADAAIEAAGATPDEAERKAQYQIACEQIAAELPHIYLYDRSDVHLSRLHVVNFEVNPWGNQTWNAEEWDIQ
ncbi:MAG: peptide ABC transporter substrate-binding protein [Chloroflexi bacterium]|nr:peptide ABC transporter substrate-binding protein [Chloroflexota bacterium]